MYVLSKRSPKRPPSGDDSACTSALVREMFPSCDGVALSEAPMNLYAAQKTHGSELNQTTAVMLQQLQSKASINAKRQWRDRKRVAHLRPPTHAGAFTCWKNLLIGLLDDETQGKGKRCPDLPAEWQTPSWQRNA